MVTISYAGPRLLPSSGIVDSLVIILHGYGADGANLIDLGKAWQNLLPNTEFLAPNAPTVCPGSPSGYQWFDLQDFSLITMGRLAKDAAPSLHDYIKQCLNDRQLTADRLVLVGFSQGTMMALYVGLELEQTCAGILGYAGILLHKVPLTPRSKPPVMLVHGDHDTVVPVAATQQAEKDLQSAGITVQTKIIAGLGHTIDQESVIAGGHFIKHCLNK